MNTILQKALHSILLAALLLCSGSVYASEAEAPVSPEVADALQDTTIDAALRSIDDAAIDVAAAPTALGVDTGTPSNNSVADQDRR